MQSTKSFRNSSPELSTEQSTNQSTKQSTKQSTVYKAVYRGKRLKIDQNEMLLPKTIKRKELEQETQHTAHIIQEFCDVV